MKKLLLLLSAIITIILLSTAVFADNIKFTINENSVEIVPAPIINIGRVMVPLRALSEKLNLNIDYNNGSVLINDNARHIVFCTNTNTFTVSDIVVGEDGKTILANKSTGTMDATPVVVEGRVYVPLRFIAEAIWASVEWDAPNSTVIIKYSRLSEKLINKYAFVRTTPTPTPIETPKQSASSENPMDVMGKLANIFGGISAPPAKGTTSDIKVGSVVRSGYYMGKVQDIQGDDARVYWDSMVYGTTNNEGSEFYSGAKLHGTTWIKLSRLVLSE